MKYFSDVTKEMYETPEALEEAEAAYLEARDGCNDDVSELNPELTTNVENKEPQKPTKKQLAKDVEDAEQELQAANSELSIAQKQVEELSKDYLKAVDEILAPAKKRVQEAQQAKYNAISRFNAEYGAYQVTYTGSRAAEEMLRAMDALNARTAHIFRNFWL